MKRKFMALFISLAMIFSAVISVPSNVFTEVAINPKEIMHARLWILTEILESNPC